MVAIFLVVLVVATPMNMRAASRTIRRRKGYRPYQHRRPKWRSISQGRNRYQEREYSTAEWLDAMNMAKSSVDQNMLLLYRHLSNQQYSSPFQ